MSRSWPWLEFLLPKTNEKWMSLIPYPWWEMAVSGKRHFKMNASITDTVNFEYTARCWPIEALPHVARPSMALPAHAWAIYHICLVRPAEDGWSLEQWTVKIFFQSSRVEIVGLSRLAPQKWWASKSPRVLCCEREWTCKAVKLCAFETFWLYFTLARSDKNIHTPGTLIF